MTNDQINAAIAKALGWRVEDGVYMWTEHGIDKTAPLSMWDYCNDLNAMHEIEMTLGERLSAYGEWLCEMTLVSKENLPSCYIWHATARQRAEAFLRVMGKWEEVAK